MNTLVTYVTEWNHGSIVVKSTAMLNLHTGEITNITPGKVDNVDVDNIIEMLDDKTDEYIIYKNNTYPIDSEHPNFEYHVDLTNQPTYMLHRLNDDMTVEVMLTEDPNFPGVRLCVNGTDVAFLEINNTGIDLSTFTKNQLRVAVYPSDNSDEPNITVIEPPKNR